MGSSKNKVKGMSMALLRKNKDGEMIYNIPLALITLFVTILCVSFPASMAYGALNERVDNIQSYCTTHDILITQMDKRIQQNEVLIARSDEKLTYIVDMVDKLYFEINEMK